MTTFRRDLSETPELLDFLGTAAQRSRVPIGTLIADLQTYGPVAKNAGLTTEETAAFFGSLNAAGVSVSRVMPGINSAMRKAAAEGVTDLRKHLGDAMEVIRDAPSDVDALTVATETFGAEGAQRMVSAIRSGAVPALGELVSGLGDTTGATVRGYESAQTLSDRIAGLKNRVASWVTGNPAAVQAAAALATGVGGIATVLPAAAAGFTALWSSAALPVVAVVAAVGLVGAAVYRFRDTVAEVGAVVVTWLTSRLSSALRAAETVAGIVSDSMAAKIRSARQVVEGFGTAGAASLLEYSKGVREGREATDDLEVAAADIAGTLDAGYAAGSGAYGRGHSGPGGGCCGGDGGSRAARVWRECASGPTRRSTRADAVGHQCACGLARANDWVSAGRGGCCARVFADFHNVGSVVAGCDNDRECRRGA